MSPIERAPRIQTRRLTLRPPRAADARRIVALAGDFEVARMTSRIPHPYRPADAEAFIARAEARDPTREAVFAIELEGEGLIGVAGLRPTGSFGPEIGYWIGRPYWGRGFATEAARGAMDWAGGTWGRRAAVAGYFADNPASGRVLERAGFLPTGVVERRDSLARSAPAETRMMVWLA